MTRSGAAWTVWWAATAALSTKALLALVLGRGLRRHLPRPVVRVGAAAVCLTLAVLALTGVG